MADKKVSLGLIKQLIREEVKVRLKNRLHEQDGDAKIYKITSNDGTIVFFVAVLGDKIYNVTGDVSSLQVSNQVIGGGNTASFVKGIKTNGINFSKQGVYDAGSKVAAPYVSKFFSNKGINAANLAYGLVIENGIPTLIAYNLKNTDAAGEPTALINWRGKEFGGGGTVPQKELTPQGSSTITPLEISFDDAFVVNQIALKPEKSNKIKYFADALIRNANKDMEKNYVIVASASADKESSKEADQDLSERRAKTVADYLNKTLNQYGYSFEYLSIGQTFYWNPKSAYAVEKAVEKGASEDIINKLYDQSAPNRKLMILPKSSYKDKLPTTGNFQLKK